MTTVPFTKTAPPAWLLAFWKEIDDKTFGKGFDCFAADAICNLGVADWHGREAIRKNLEAFIDTGFTALHDVTEYWDGGSIKVFGEAITDPALLVAKVGNTWVLVLGALTAAGATGQLIFLPALAWLAVNMGWRTAAIVVAGAALLGIPLVVAFMRDRPADVGLRAYGATEADEPAPPLRNPVQAALGGLAMGLRNRNFWLLAGSFFICGASTNGLIGTHLIPASIDHGMPEVTAASLLAFIGLFDVAGTMISGWLTDRLDSRWLLFWYYGLRGLSLLFLPYAFGVQYFGLFLFIVFYGLDWVATVPPTVALTADTFGRRNLGVVYGWVFASHQLGAAAAATAAGAVRTYFGDYQIAFMTSGLLCLLAAGLVIRISRARGPETVAAPPLPAPSY